jgi:pimeloyl-ACP methyl ester carboxylesterase
MTHVLHGQEIEIPPHALPGNLAVPDTASGLVIFAHGSGSSRLSPRNRRVARALNGSGLATLLFDLLSHQEAEGRENVFNIPLLAERLQQAINWCVGNEETAQFPIGLFGASTGAAAALRAAALAPDHVSAVVSRGGRPDLAADALAAVKAPTLLIVGELDDIVIDLNRRAMRQLRCPNRLEIVPGATHLFEEPGTLEVVVGLARDWFLKHLQGTST